MATSQAVLGRAPVVKKSAGLALAAVFSAYGVSYLYMYALNVASPQIAADLNGMALYAWAISIPALASAFVTLIFGKLSDMYGRRTLLLACMGFFTVGAVLAALSQDFVFNIVARFILALGQGALAPLCFSVIGDLFDAGERAKWSGWLNVPAGVAATVAPTLAGMLTDTLSWRYLFWLMVPLVLITGALVLIGVPSLSQKAAHKIDFIGSVFLAVASATLILAFSMGGSMYPWGSAVIIGLFVVSTVFWGLFLWWEGRAEEPMLDLQVLTNRTFITAAGAGFMSFFGLMAIMMYYPLYLQGVQATNATVSGQMITPFSMLMSFMGVPAGLALARTRRYKWMFILGYGILTLAMFGMVTFGINTPGWMSVLVTALAGLGLGAIPTVNTLVAQYAVPRRLLGVAVGAIFFFVMMGMAITPSILGTAMNMTYSSTLAAHLPVGLDAATLAMIADPRVLLSPDAMVALQGAVSDPAMFDQTIQAIRAALESSLQTVNWIGAVTMLISFVMILTIPEVSIEAEVAEKPKA